MKISLIKFSFNLIDYLYFKDRYQSYRVTFFSTWSREFFCENCHRITTLCSPLKNTRSVSSQSRSDALATKFPLDSKISKRLGSSCVAGGRANVCRRRRRRWRQGDEGPPRGRRTLSGREAAGASQEDYRKQIISVEIPLANSLGTLLLRCSVSGPKLPAELQARTEIVEARRSALLDLLWQ